MADSIATKMHATAPSQYIRLPGSGVHFLIDKNIVTSNYNTRIRYHSSDKQLRQRLIEKEQWTQDQFQVIALELHYIAVSRMYHHKKFICKLLHDMLPTGKRVHHYSSHYDHRCPSCRTPYEDRSHFLGCSQRSRWRHDAWSSIKTFAGGKSRCVTVTIIHR
jgi:hypothetical protein